MPYKDKEKANESARKRYQNNKEKKKEYYENNKEYIAERAKERYENNKEEILERKKEYNRIYSQSHKEERAEYYQNTKERDREKTAEQTKIYNQTPAGKKSRMMAKWRSRGVINVNDEMYNHYIASTHCECCSKEFSSSRDRHLDHDHETGEYRWVICCSCNNHDNWKKITH
tara:strand:+ start:233 stop:748 length:516 start_codon:yes stop_codon:yes gene_type:complete